MKWKVKETLVCPQTGTAFSKLNALANLNVTIWYEADAFLPPGSQVEPYTTGVKVNGKFTPLTVYNITTFNKELWETMKTKIACPGNSPNFSGTCEYPYPCAVKVCPYK